MEKIKIKPNLFSQFEERPLSYSGKWTNIFFAKNGESHQSKRIYNTQEETFLSAEKAAKMVIYGVGDGYIGGRKIKPSEFSHHIQIPITQKNEGGE